MLRACVLMMALAVTSCAGAPADNAASQNSPVRGQLDFRIHNNMIPPSTITVYLVPRAGVERELGTIFGSGEQTLQYRGLPLQGEYQLVARADTRELASPIVILTHVLAMDWDLQRNYVQVTKVQE